MSLIAQSLQNLANGVSQQPAIQRLPSQAERQENCVATVIDGLRRRPPSLHVARLSTSATYEDAMIHLIDRDQSERYAAVFLKTGIQVYDLTTGEAQTVTAPNGFGYLDCSRPKDALRATTAADYTFVLNREYATGMLADTSPEWRPEAMLFFRSANFKEKFIVNLDGVRIVMELPKADTGDNNRYALVTSELATRWETWVRTGVNTSPPAGADPMIFSSDGAIPTGFVFTVYGSVIHIYRTDGDDFAITADDGEGGSHLRAIKGAVQTLSDLPKKGVPGFKVKVIGDPLSEGTDFFVRYDEETTSNPLITSGAVGGGLTPPPPPPGGGDGDPIYDDGGMGGYSDPFFDPWSRPDDTSPWTTGYNTTPENIP